MIDAQRFATIRDDMGVAADDVSINLWYPRSEGAPKGFIIGLIDIRYASDIRVEYDFDRNGWKIERPTDGPSAVWVEAAFVRTEDSK